MIHKRPSSNKGKVLVTFGIPGSIWADRINLVSEFNDWDRESLPFRRNSQEDWQIEVELDVGREYRFRYLFDGDCWCSDREADRFVPNPYGSYDAILVVDVLSE